MAEIVNLRQARKRKARAVAADVAAANRVTYGRTVEERRATTAERRRGDAVLDGAKRDRD